MKRWRARCRLPPEDTRSAIGMARKLFVPSESGDAFQKRYFDAIQRDPAVVMEHAELARLFNSEPAEPVRREV